LIPYLLGNCESILQIKAILADLNITNIPFSSSVPLTSLHWMISDEKQSIVIESMKDGLKIYDNPVGVLTNNPPFPYHLANLNNYLNVTSDYVENRFSNEIELSAYGVGMGAMGLPGDVSSSSRFVRAAFNKFNSVCDEDEDSSVAQFFHILDSVAMVKGCAKTKAGKVDMTTYSCCMNGKQNIYYYKTYTNNQITAIRMNEKEMNANKLSVFLLKEKEQIHYEN
ncbi:MAG: linear amide C-N hydrolase, partial [Erysipelotrichia bacterium]|nr:linear amide C-N hydrolase [Erysipelotrichia bacterium]